jgi:putative transposase
VARILQVTRQAIYRVPKPRSAPQRRPPADETERAIVETAKENPTDGYRMVWALTRRKLGRAVNRKRVLRVDARAKLIQRRRAVPRRRPGYFRVERPAQLWHMDMSAVWVAEHGWCYLNAVIDCCTREIVGWGVETRCRAVEAMAVVERAVACEAIRQGTLTLGTDNGSAFTARKFKALLSSLGVRRSTAPQTCGTCSLTTLATGTRAGGPGYQGKCGSTQLVGSPCSRSGSPTGSTRRFRVAGRDGPRARIVLRHRAARRR